MNSARLWVVAAGLVVAAVGAFVVVDPVSAIPGDLDPSFAGFGDGGYRVVAGRAETMAVAPDGKIVTAANSGVQILLRRYMPDGSYDPSFDLDGVATFLNTAYSMEVDALAVQADGRIVVGGTTGQDDYLVFRVRESGSLDTTFGGGYVTTDFHGQGDACHGLVVLADGRIVAAGTSRVGGDEDFSVARYLPGGALDTTFGGDGKVTIGFGGYEECWDVALQDDGMLVLVGEYYNEWDADYDFAVARLDHNGALDDSFDFDGKASYGFDGVDKALAVAIQDDGKIVVAGTRTRTAGALARLWPNGVPDNSLDGDGKLIVADSEGFEDVVVQPDGRIVAIGHRSDGSEALLAFHRILISGSPDPTFGNGGAATFDLGAFDRGRNLVLLPDGRILGHGTSDPGATCFIRLWQDGSIDGGGTTALGFPASFLGPGSHERPAGMVVQPDGKLVVAGEIANAGRTEYDFGVARFLPDGSPDLSFGTLGCATLDFHNVDIARAVALQPDGKIVVAGHAGSGDNVNFLVARFNADGTPDMGFGFSGFNVLDFLGGPDRAQAVAIAPDGKIVLAGTAFNGARDVFGICRFTSEGYADFDFDLDAKQLHEIVPGTVHWVSSVVVQADRKIVIGGQANADFALARYHESGAVDFSFGPAGQGFVLHDMGGNDFLGALLRAPDGRFFAAGSHEQLGNSDFALAQFSPDGVPGGTWIGGRAYIDFTGYDIAFAIDLREDGEVVAAGVGNSIITWAQWNTNTTDPPHAGWTDLVGAGESGVGVSFVGPRHLVVAAIQDYAGNQNFALAKFETVPSTSPVPVEEPTAPDTQFALRLHAATPNPVADHTVIAFELAQAQNVRLSVYDAAGRRVRVLADGAFAAGRHERTWDSRDEAGRSVAAGVYIMRAEGGAARALQKVIVMK